MGKLALCIPREEHSLPFEEWKPRLIDRDICENDPEFLQVIPYVVAIDNDTNTVFMYRRGQAGGEDKLKTKWSIGLGGHIDEMPKEDETIINLIAREAARELEEEVGLVIDPNECEIYQTAFINGSKLPCIYLPYSDNPVDHVHLGVLIIQIVDKNTMTNHEKDVIDNGTWVSPEELVSIASGKDENKVLEYWSQVAAIDVINEIISNNMNDRMNINFVDSMKQSA